MVDNRMKDKHRLDRQWVPAAEKSDEERREHNDDVTKGG
jgi:hypothetical protein